MDFNKLLEKDYIFLDGAMGTMLQAQGLIIIDTLKRVREAGGADYSYASDYDVVARLKALADSYKVSMLIVHHTRKQKSEDIFDMISGTNGLMGAADGAFVLSKDKRISNNATLDVAGRDQQDMKIHLVRDSERLVSVSLSPGREFKKSKPTSEVYIVILFCSLASLTPAFCVAMASLIVEISSSARMWMPSSFRFVLYVCESKKRNTAPVRYGRQCGAGFFI